MARKNKNNKGADASENEQKNRGENTEFFGSADDETDIENDIADLGYEEDDGTIVAEPPQKHGKFFFGFAVVTIILALIGLYATVMFTVNTVNRLLENAPVREDFARFILPVTSNDVAPFANESELPNSVKITAAVWNILLNHDISLYSRSDAGELIIPEYDVGVSCKELFGEYSELVHQSTGSTDTKFIYNYENHTYICTYNLRYLSYVPRITDMREEHGVYTVTVDYLQPSLSAAAQNLGRVPEAEKTMEYTIRRTGGTNTLLSVRTAETTEGSR